MWTNLFSVAMHQAQSMSRAQMCCATWEVVQKRGEAGFTVVTTAEADRMAKADEILGRWA